MLCCYVCEGLAKYAAVGLRFRISAMTWNTTVDKWISYMNIQKIYTAKKKQDEVIKKTKYFGLIAMQVYIFCLYIFVCYFKKYKVFRHNFYYWLKLLNKTFLFPFIFKVTCCFLIWQFYVFIGHPFVFMHSISQLSDYLHSILLLVRRPRSTPVHK